MVYTTYEMIRDCRADRAEGWRYFIVQYIPVVQRLLTHYAPDGSVSIETVIRALRRPESPLFQSLEPAPERWFVAELRQKVLEQIQRPAPGFEIDLDTVAAALEPLTLLEKQVAWMETMWYDTAATGAMLRMSPATAGKIRERASDLIRGKVDNWSRTLFADSGLGLGRAAASAGTDQCLNAKVFLDVLDGRMTWRGREEMEGHVLGCWHCIDHFCRMAETVELLRGIAPLPEAQAAPFRKLIGVETAKAPRWKHLFGAG